MPEVLIVLRRAGHSHDDVTHVAILDILQDGQVAKSAGSRGLAPGVLLLLERKMRIKHVPPRAYTPVKNLRRQVRQVL